MAGVLAPATLKVKTMLDLTMLRKQLPEVVARLATRNFVFPEKEFNELEAARKTVQTCSRSATCSPVRSAWPRRTVRTLPP